MMIPGFSTGLKEKATASFLIVKSNIIPAAWIANPKFLNDLDFEQDKVRPLHEVFKSSDTTTIKSIIDEFIIFNKRLMGLGIIDKSFNITKNYGLDKENNVVLIDIGELFNNPEHIKKQLSERAWDKKYVAGCIEDVEARKYFIEEMDKHFNQSSSN